MSIGLYTHVPFCVRKCNYCSFVSMPREDGPVSLYINSLAAEMAMRAPMLSREGKAVDSIYIGGGTPTCLSGKELAGILANVYSQFDIAKGAEITVEANPGTVGGGKLAALRDQGVNRLSMGFQACHPDLLAVLGRIHSYPEALAAFKEARLAGFDNINVDLVFGVPGQTADLWRECLKRVADLRPDHISAYGLQLEEGTPLFRRVRDGLLEPCPEDTEAEMFHDLIGLLKACGYEHYEISNFALPGRACRHNLKYWHNLEYLGLGPAAHSNIGGRRFSNEASLQLYAEMLEEGRLPVDWQEETDKGTEMSETVFLGLRLIEGLDLSEFRERFGKSIDDVYRKEIRRLTDLKLVERMEGRLRLTPRGLFLGNSVFAEFVQPPG